MGATVTAVGPSSKKDKQLRVVPFAAIQAEILNNTKETTLNRQTKNDLD